MSSVLVLGMAVADYMFFVDAFPDGPVKTRAKDVAVVGGGCAANAAVAVAKLGGQAVLSARLGRDAVGQTILDDLQAEGVDTSLCDCSGRLSSYSSVLIDATGERQIVNFRGRDLVESTHHIAGAPMVSAVLADTRWINGALAAMQLATARGVPGILDAEAPIDPVLLGAASHIAFSLQGLASLHPELAPQDAIASVAAAHGAWVCVTMGAEGVLYHGADEAGHVPAFDVTAVDTLGAGDVWHGAFALRLAEGAGERDAVHFANAVAALKCTRRGGRAGTPSRAETEDFIREAAVCN